MEWHKHIIILKDTSNTISYQYEKFITLFQYLDIDYKEFFGDDFIILYFKYNSLSFSFKHLSLTR